MQAGEERTGAYWEELLAWAQSHGSGRLAMALRGDLGESPEDIYVRERRDQELPSFLLGVEDWQTERLSDPVAELLELVADLEEYMQALDIGYASCEPVLVAAREADGLYGDAPGVRITGWLDRHVLIGLAPSARGLGLPTISTAFPAGVPSVTGDVLRPTGYGSAYDVRHPAAQEALRNAAVVLIDMFPEGEPEWDLRPIWPEDARDLIDAELVNDLMDTVFLVGWKLGQPTRLRLSSFAEHIAAVLIFQEAESQLELYAENLPENAQDPALENLRYALDGWLDDDFAEHLPYIDRLPLELFVPEGARSRRMSLWAPLHRTAGDPPPRITSGEEPDWSVTSLLGATPAEAVKASQDERDAEKRENLREVASLLAGVRWEREVQGVRPLLAGAATEGRGRLVLHPPPVGPTARTWSVWTLERYPTAEAAANPDVESDEHWHLSWDEFFEALPRSDHPLAVDLVLEVVRRTMNWALGVVGHALPGGQLDPIQEAPRLLDGAAALREHLEEVRAQGLVHDTRLSRHGINHPQFGRPEGMRFLAKARFGISDDRDFAQVQADFNQSIYDFSPLPVSLGVEPYSDDDGTVLVKCALSAPSVEDAFELSHEVITQVRWRVGLTPIDLESGDDDDEIQYEVEDLQPDSSEMDTDDDT